MNNLTNISVSYLKLLLAIVRYDMDDAVNNLTSKEKEIVIMRFGLRSGVTQSLEDVGKDFGVTRERIRQIEARALEKIRQYFKKLYFKKGGE